MPADFVEYRGERFYLQSSKRYYQSGRKNVPERLLHRRIWSDLHGPIPEGMTIHHKDGDWRNNDLSNLEALPVAEHCRAHMRERWSEEESREAFMRGLGQAREAAKQWHASEEGKAWHREHGRQSWGKAQPQELFCTVCSAAFFGHPTAGVRFCSRACRQKSTYRNRFTAERCCQACGQTFKGSRYRETRFCSRACSNRSRAAVV